MYHNLFKEHLGFLLAIISKLVVSVFARDSWNFFFFLKIPLCPTWGSNSRPLRSSVTCCTNRASQAPFTKPLGQELTLNFRTPWAYECPKRFFIVSCVFNTHRPGSHHLRGVIGDIILNFLEDSVKCTWRLSSSGVWDSFKYPTAKRGLKVDNVCFSIVPLSPGSRISNWFTCETCLFAEVLFPWFGIVF